MTVLSRKIQRLIIEFGDRHKHKKKFLRVPFFTIAVLIDEIKSSTALFHEFVLQRCAAIVQNTSRVRLKNIHLLFNVSILKIFTAQISLHCSFGNTYIIFNQHLSSCNLFACIDHFLHLSNNFLPISLRYLSFGATFLLELISLLAN